MHVKNRLKKLYSEINGSLHITYFVCGGKMESVRKHKKIVRESRKMIIYYYIHIIIMPIT